MTHEERLKAFQRYKSKMLLIGQADVVEAFSIEEDKIAINFLNFAKAKGCPEELEIPNFVEKII